MSANTPPLAVVGIEPSGETGREHDLLRATLIAVPLDLVLWAAVAGVGYLVVLLVRTVA